MTPGGQVERIMAKRVRWTARVGQVSTGRPGIEKGELFYMGYQKAAGGRKHSGGVGRRASRFYQGRYGRPSAPVRRAA